jgi:hypothetical protein
MSKIVTLLAATAALLLTATAANAAIDTVLAPTGFFVPNDALKFSPPYYRGAGQDWGWTHGAIAPGFTSASLNISAFDVDSPAENDIIQALDSGTWTTLGSLTGLNNQWVYSNTFSLGANFFDDINTGLNVRILIDQGPSRGWIVTLGKSVLATDGSTLPNPLPGVPEPASWAMMIAGFGLVGAAMRRRRTNFVVA